MSEEETTQPTDPNPDDEAISPFAGVGRVDPLVFVQQEDAPEARPAASNIPRNFRPIAPREVSPRQQDPRQYTTWTPGGLAPAPSPPPNAPQEPSGAPRKAEPRLPGPIRLLLSFIAIAAPLALLASAVWLGFSLTK